MIFSSLLFLTGIGFQELVLLLIPLVLWVWAIIDVLIGRFESAVVKVIWILVIFFIPFFGPLIYLIVGRKQRTRSA